MHQKLLLLDGSDIRGYELLEFVDTPVDELDPLVVQQDQLLHGWLFSALSPSSLSQVAAYTSSHDVWSALQNIFNTKSRSRKLQLWHEPSTFKKDGLTTNQYLAPISKKADEVKDAGIVVEDE